MLTGGCYCGQVRYETDAPPFHETTCYCSDCRRVVGAPSVAWFSVKRTALRLTAGVPTRYGSSPGVVRQFCGTCGTSLTYAADRHPDEIDVTLASLDDPAVLPPKDHTQTESKLPWQRVCDDLPAYATIRPGRSGSEA